jgi:predicted nucleic acid-binding protein
MGSRILVDTNVLVDLLNDDPEWADWSSDAFCACGDYATLVINTTIYAELAVRYDSADELDSMIASAELKTEDVPWPAAFLAGKAFAQYRRAGGARGSPLPDFYIGAHAAVTNMALLTRDPARYRTYFPDVELLSPPGA